MVYCNWCGRELNLGKPAVKSYCGTCQYALFDRHKGVKTNTVLGFLAMVLFSLALIFTVAATINIMK